MGKIPLCCYLLLWENREYAKCFFLLSVGMFCQKEVNFLLGNFTGEPIMNLIPDWESEIVNQSGLQTNSSENWCYCGNERALQKKIVSLKDFLKKKESLQDKVSITKFSYQMLPWISFKVT